MATCRRSVLRPRRNSLAQKDGSHRRKIASPRTRKPLLAAHQRVFTALLDTALVGRPRVHARDVFLKIGIRPDALAGSLEHEQDLNIRAGQVLANEKLAAL